MQSVEHKLSGHTPNYAVRDKTLVAESDQT